MKWQILSSHKLKNLLEAVRSKLQNKPVPTYITAITDTTVY